MCWVVLEIPKVEPTPWVKFLGAFETMDEAVTFARAKQEERPESVIYVHLTTQL